MNRSDVTERFLEIELETGLFDITPEGAPIWEWMRYHAYRDILYELDIMGQMHSEPNEVVRSNLKGVYLWGKNFISRNPLRAGEHDFLFYGNSRRKRLQDGYWWDIHCDPIHEHIDLDYCQVESDYNLEHLEPAKTDNLYYLDNIHYTDTLKRRLGITQVQIDPESKRKLSKAEEEFNKQLGVSLELLDRARHQLKVRANRKPQFEKMLSRIDPSIAVIICSYGKETFIEVCKDRDITVVELQHGTPAKEHMGYSYPDNRDKETFPDYFLTYGEQWNDWVEYPLPEDHVIAVGFPYLEQTRKQYSDVPTRNQILFISQGSIGEGLSKFAVELSKTQTFEYDLVYKLHPGEYDRWRTSYPWLDDSDISVIDSSEPPLYELFANSCAQIGVNSTAVYEGATFDLNTFIYSISGWENLRPLLDNGAAQKIGSVGQFLSKFNEKKRKGNNSTDKFFKCDAIKNAEEELTKLSNSN